MNGRNLKRALLLLVLIPLVFTGQAGAKTQHDRFTEVGEAIAVSNATVTAIATVNTYSSLNFGSTAVLGPNNSVFVLSNQSIVALDYIGSGLRTGVYRVNFDLTTASASATLWEFRILQNGFAFPMQFVIQFGGTGAPQQFAFSVPIEGLVNGDQIRMVLRNVTDDTDITIRNAHFRIDLD